MTRAALLFGACIACTPVGEMVDAAGAETGNDDAGGDAAGGEQDAGPIGDCSKQAPGGYQIIASGTVSSSDVSASFCGALAWLYTSPFTTPKNEVLLFLDSVNGTVHVDSPSDAIYGMLSGMMQVGAAAPGVYTVDGSCGFLSFTYWLPAPPNVDCGDASGPNCPTGCTTACSSQGCFPCQPIAPEAYFHAAGISDCSQSGQATPIGSWTITLTSVTLYTPTDANGPKYVVHGTVAGTLLGGDGGTVNLTATF